MPDAAEALMTVQCLALPGADARNVAGRLADAVSALPVPAAAGVGQFEVLASEVGAARALAEKQRMFGDAAADYFMFVARTWYLPDDQFHPGDWYEVAAVLRPIWEGLRGERTGITDVTVWPVGFLIGTDEWLKMARTCGWWQVTANAPDGLIPL